jgi:hypothetical protein
MNETIAVKEILHVHYWIPSGQEVNLDNGGIEHLYKCSGCNKVKRQ